MQNIIELSNRYAIQVSNTGYSVSRLELNEAGAWEMTKPHFCTCTAALFDHLFNCELNQDDIECLKDCKTILAAMRAEFQEFQSRSWA